MKVLKLLFLRFCNTFLEELFFETWHLEKNKIGRSRSAYSLDIFSIAAVYKQTIYNAMIKKIE